MEKLELWEEFVDYVCSLQDSTEHKEYLLSNEDCFHEWVEDNYG